MSGRHFEKAYDAKNTPPPVDSVRDISSPWRGLSSLPGVLQYWWLEILTCFLMLSMLLAIVGTLSPHQGKTLPEWPFHLSINTVVSVLATVLKIAMLFILSQILSQLKWRWFTRSRPLQDLTWFDAASRGPFGCLQFLFSVKGMHLVASTTALLVILSVAIDPFIQQLIHYVSCPQIVSNVSATIPRSSIYQEVGHHTDDGVFPPSTPVLAYINQGLYNPSSVKTPFTCSSGNCTFGGRYNTLGYCATCEDLSQNVSIFRPFASSPSLDLNTWINTSLPSGTYASYKLWGDSTQKWFTMNYTDAWTEMVLAAPALHGSNASFYYRHFVSSGSKGPSYQNSGCTTAYDNTTWACQGDVGTGAARCRLDPCVRTYEASVEFGQLEERLVNTHTNMFFGNLEYWTMADLDCAGADVRARLLRSGFTIPDDTALIPWNVCLDIFNDMKYEPQLAGTTWPDFYNNVTMPGPYIDNTTLPVDIVPAQCIYQMYTPTVSSLRAYISQNLQESINPGLASFSTDGPSAVRAIFNDSYVNFASINGTFQAIAELITSRIRQYGVPGQDQFKQPVRGSVVQNATCVSVRWPFFIFPVALAALTVFSLIAAIIETEAGGMNNATRGWKSSLLPVVFNEIVVNDSSERKLAYEDSVRMDTSIESMDRIGTQTRARLRMSVDDAYIR